MYVYLADARGNGFYREGKIVDHGLVYDLAALLGIITVRAQYLVGISLSSSLLFTDYTFL